MSRAAETKDDRLQVRLDAESKSVLQRAASYRHKTVSQFVLATALEEAEKVIRENEIVTLSGPGWKLFYDALTIRRHQIRPCARPSPSIRRRPDEAGACPLGDHSARQQGARSRGILLRGARTRPLYPGACLAGRETRCGASLCRCAGRGANSVDRKSTRLNSSHKCENRIP